MLSMSQGGFSSKGPEVESLKTIGMPSCTASTPAHSVSRGACFGPCSPLDGLPCGASSLHLHMPSVRASCSGNPGLPEPFCGDGGNGISSPLHAVLSAQGSNASGFAMPGMRVSWHFSQCWLWPMFTLRWALSWRQQRCLEPAPAHALIWGFLQYQYRLGRNIGIWKDPTWNNQRLYLRGICRRK